MGQKEPRKSVHIVAVSKQADALNSGSRPLPLWERREWGRPRRNTFSSCLFARCVVFKQAGLEWVHRLHGQGGPLGGTPHTCKTAQSPLGLQEVSHVVIFQSQTLKMYYFFRNRLETQPPPKHSSCPNVRMDPWLWKNPVGHALPGPHSVSLSPWSIVTPELYFEKA